ncbi:MAG: DUF5916 domain-containing protein [Terriglobales bacterium]
MHFYPRIVLYGLISVAAVARMQGAESVALRRVSHPPRIEDFGQSPPQGAARELTKVSGFIQNQPSDGQPATQRTEAYLGYDSTNIYVAFVCEDQSPGAIRGHLTRREPSTPFDAEDYVEITLDTFRDQRHAFVFDINPRGVQADALRTEGQGNDYSWDTVWNSWSRVTERGYVILAAIPFKSLRFHGSSAAGWGITLMRYLSRNDENDYWPRVSSRISGLLNQEATVTGLENISPSHNMQFIPYGEARSFRALDQRDPVQSRFDSCTFCGKIGLDSKFVFHDSLVLDTTIRPDFAQIESDEPQNTINQRFEVFFPEKRPFFLENSNFFEAPLIAVGQQTRMVFTRRIADPTAGVRLTGKQGPWNLGFFAVDDRSPGEIVTDSDPLHGQRAYFGIGRVSYDIGNQSAIGAMYTHREFQGMFNRVGGLDGVFRLNKNWNATYRGYMSSTLDTTGYLFGQHHEGVLFGNGRRFTLSLQYLDITPNFRTETGFVPRTDQRALNEYGHFYFRPEGKHLVFHGPEENGTQMWDHTNTVVQQNFSFDYVFAFRGNIIVAPIVAYESDVLRPQDFPGLPGKRQFVQEAWGLVFKGSFKRFLSWNTKIIRDGIPVVVPAAGQLPYTGNETAMTQTLTVRPTGSLQIDNTYILDRVTNGAVQHAVFNNHIIRSKWNYQFTRELSLRFIGQYNGLLSNPVYSSLQTQKAFNTDILLTYLVHPGTAIYVGYNTNQENVSPGLCVHLPGSTECDPSGNGLVRTRGIGTNDGRLFFVKVSYLWRR